MDKNSEDILLEKMKAIEVNDVKMVVNPDTFLPELEFKVKMNLETMQDSKSIFSDSDIALIFGATILDKIHAIRKETT